MPLFKGTGGAIFEIALPDPAQLESGALVPVEPPKPAPKRPARKRPTESPEEG